VIQPKTRVALYPVKFEGELICCAETGRVVGFAGTKYAVQVGERVVQIEADKVEALTDG
jgi:hypothetical protein